MNAVDLVAKLLATENLTIVRSNNKTAYFDVKSRVLSLPLWKDMTPEIEGMLVAHEVGHALYTPLQQLESAADNGDLFSYVNVIEDARIEKLMKRKYPGIRKTFNLGYTQLMERDFFELKDRDLNKMLLIDRINLYFKAGYNCGVKFSKTEKEFVERIERCETPEEVFALASEVLEYTKEELSVHKEEMQAITDLEAKERSEDVDPYEMDPWDIDGNGEFKEVEDDEEGNVTVRGMDETPITNEEIMPERELASETDRALHDKLSEMADDSVRYTYHKLFTAHAVDPIVPFKQVITETGVVDTILNSPEYADTKTNFTKFMAESEKMVNYLVKEFEMRKSAHAYKRTKIAKSGSLNMNKVFAHKLTDDIFKRITVMPNAKNHGMVFLLDWSGSMHDVIMPTVKQVINLCMFCRRIQIPFEVYAFSGSYMNRRIDDIERGKINQWNHAMRQRKGENLIYTDGYYKLLQLFSNRMTNSEFLTVARRFTTHAIGTVPGYALGDTPLNDALVYMIDYLPKFKKVNNIEKLTFITLTDGQSSGLDATDGIYSFGYDNGKHTKYKRFLRDDKTGKDYEITQEPYLMTEVLLRMIRQQNDAKVLGFYICKNRMSYLRGVFDDHYGAGMQDYYKRTEDIAEMRKEFKENGFASLKNTGRDDLFIIPDSATEIVDDNAMNDIDGDLSAAVIARKFGKMFNTKKHSRVLLDRFIGYVA